MNAQSAVGQLARPAVTVCWNRIGIHGDKSCVELKQHLHCRNCPVYSATARALLDAPLPLDYSEGWTQHFARPSVLTQTEQPHSVVVFRLGNEWLALPTGLCSEVAETRTIHSLPHRRNSAVLGIANVRGELLVCLSLATILGLQVSHSGQDQHDAKTQRLLVFRHSATAAMFPVDEVHSVHRYAASQLTDVPATVGNAQATYTKAILSGHERTVGVLDEQLLFYTIDRSLA